MPAAPPFPDVSNGPEQERPPSRLRLFGLLTVVTLVAALPLAGAAAGPVGDDPVRPAAQEKEPAQTARTARTGAADRTDGMAGGKAEGEAGGKAGDKTDGMAAGAADEKSEAASDRSSSSSSSSLLTGLGLAAAAQCGPQLTSPEGIEAQTCVLRQERDTWARTYYRNTTGRGLSTVLTLMAPDGRTMRITCAVGAEDEPGMCETPRGRTRAEPARYAAVAEYAADGDGPLLLRSGSNSAPTYGR
jgi:hypothetical protein